MEPIKQTKLSKQILKGVFTMRKKILCKTTIVILFSFIISNAAVVNSSDFYKKIWSLSVQIMTGYKPLTEERVAVGDLTTLNGEPCDLGKLIAERMTRYLTRSDNFILVERTFLKRVMEENQITHSRLFEKATANKLGRLVGAKAIITGTVTDLGSVVDANARLINCEDGRILSTASTAIKKSEEVEKLLPQKEVDLPEDKLSSEYEEFKFIIEKLKILDQKIMQPESTLKIDIWTDRFRYHIGEEITFYCKANRDCYLTIIDIGASANITVLFPNKFKQNNFIQANMIYKIPSEGYDIFAFKIDPPSGIDRVKAIASLTPLTIENYQFRKYAFRSIGPTDVSGTRDIGVYFNELSKVTWAKDSLSILIE